MKCDLALSMRGSKYLLYASVRVLPRISGISTQASIPDEALDFTQGPHPGMFATTLLCLGFPPTLVVGQTLVDLVFCHGVQPSSDACEKW